jgi:hypothetical protein
VTEPGSIDHLIKSLEERAKELHCIYHVDEKLADAGLAFEEKLRAVVEVLPAGYQYPSACRARIVLSEKTFSAPDFVETGWMQSADIPGREGASGRLDVVYLEERPAADEGPFLKEERKLLKTIAGRLALALEKEGVKPAAARGGGEAPVSALKKGRDWGAVVEFLKVSDQPLLLRLSRKMINHLCLAGVEAAHRLLQRFSPAQGVSDAFEDNRPLAKSSRRDLLALSEEIFQVAAVHMRREEILKKIQQWIRDDQSSFLLDALERPASTIIEISDAIQRYQDIAIDEGELPRATRTALRVLLMRRFFTGETEFIQASKHFVDVRDFYEVARRIVSPQDGHGQLGGKSSGLFMASQVVRKSQECADVLSCVRTPKTWYVSSDSLFSFIQYNHLDDVYNRKYLEVEQIRREYPHIVQVFKNSHFPPDLLQGLSRALDEFEEKPLIVRSSSLLEDRLGAAFSGKYKSLFLANQGSKKERLAALCDAIAEVYASVFGPDPIEYRTERGLLDLHEEMGIMIQEVVGTRAGDFFLPTVAGVAFSHNEFRWSPRIKREDGLLRMVPGLGTRAVDRLGDDFPVLLAPGQPGLRVNMSPDETVRYSPKSLDAINLMTRRFESVDAGAFLKAHGAQLPGVEDLVSIVEEGRLRRPLGFDIDFDRDNLVFTFEGLIHRTPFVARIRTLLKLLREKLGVPVDLEFACDGRHLFLLQCRPQSFNADTAPASIPEDLPRDKVLFTAHRHVSNGRVPDITHVVYVDPAGYKALPSLEDLQAVGRAVGRLNKLLPKRRFILMGPGRWGSRGDIKLGVSVTYSDINNTAALIEIARKEGGYVPDLSFGTHFFQDLVEASIRYLPLYPDEPGEAFQESFFTGSRNILADLLGEFAHLAGTVRVIDVPKSSGGQVLKLLMDADKDLGVGLLGLPCSPAARPDRRRDSLQRASSEHWRWRQRMAETVASRLEAERFGVRGLYLIGSVKTAMAGPESDIDFLVHFSGTEAQRRELESWFDGWSQALSEFNALRTGTRLERLLDVHFIGDEEVSGRVGLAAKIGGVTDEALPLRTRP